MPFCMRILLLWSSQNYLFIMSDNLSDSFTLQPPLPFGQRVVSEAYDFQPSVKVSQDSVDYTQMFSTLKETIENAKSVLNNPRLSESERVKQSLKILEQQPQNIAQSIVKVQQKSQKPLSNLPLKAEQQLEETIQIVLDQMSEFQSEQSKEKTSRSSDNSFNREYQRRKKQANGGNMTMEQEIHELKRRLHSKETELIILMKEKSENEARLQGEIDELLAKMERGTLQHKKVGRFQDKSQDMGKMNKWVQNLKQMLQNAQRQTVSVKEQLKKCDETIKEKDEEIRQLRRKFVQQQSKILNIEEICDHIQASYNKTQLQHCQGFKDQLSQFINQLA